MHASSLLNSLHKKVSSLFTESFYAYKLTFAFWPNNALKLILHRKIVIFNSKARSIYPIFNCFILSPFYVGLDCVLARFIGVD
jgi:hypothetical protein